MSDPDKSTTQDSPRDLMAELNAAQRSAATTTDGALLVIAGAGSGKTRTLVYRLAHLVQQGVPPEAILLLTFTRRSAQEMLRRASQLVDERCRRVTGGTYHAFANSVLRRFAQQLGYGPSFTIIDRSDAVDLVGMLRSSVDNKGRQRRFPRADTLVNLFSKRINTHRSLKEVLEEEMPQFLDDLTAIERIESQFAQRKLEQNIMDYDDLLVQLRRLLIEQPGIRKKLGATFRYIMVDEYQDTNRLQAQIAALLAAGHGNIMVVGDDAQSIYSFRGANFRNIIDFPKLFPDCHTTLLEQNYRSTPPILDLANKVLEKAREKFSKRLFSHLEGTQKPFFVRTTDDHSQAQFICDKILELREDGVPLSDMAVLSRAAWHSNVLELELGNRNIPFRKFGGIRFVEAAHIKDVSALLKISLNPLDTAAWFRVLQLFDGIGPKTAQQIAQDVVAQDGDPAALVSSRYEQRRYAAPLASLYKLLNKLRDENLDLSQRLEMALEAYKAWMVHKYDDAVRRQQDLKALEVVAGRYEDLEAFLSDLAIDPPDFVHTQPQEDSEDEWLTVSTVHSAKGLEWQTVFVLHMNAGRFPTFNTSDHEEERRLFYVAITRSKRLLYLLKPEELTGRGGFHEIGELSPLIAEVDDFASLTEEVVFSPGQQDMELAEGESSASDDASMQRILDYFGDN